MTIWSTIDSARRTFLRRLTRRLGKSRLDGKGNHPDKLRIKRILVCRPNHRLGNLLLVSPLLTEIGRVLPHAKVDLFVKGHIAPSLFANYCNVGKLIQLPKKPLKNFLRYLGAWGLIMTRRYDIVVNAVFNSSSGRISARVTNARFRFLGEIDDVIRDTPSGHEHMARFPVYSFRRFMRQLGIHCAEEPIASPDLRLTAAEIDAGRQLLNEILRNDKRTIALYTFATGAKCYEKDWWQALYQKLLIAFPTFNIIEVLPIENLSQIDFEAPSFYSKDLRQIASLIANVDVFIGADSGMMHLASASRTPVVGLFKTDNMNTYAPYNEGSVGIDTRVVGMDALVGLVHGIIHRVEWRMRSV